MTTTVSMQKRISFCDPIAVAKAYCWAHAVFPSVTLQEYLETLCDVCGMEPPLKSQRGEVAHFVKRLNERRSRLDAWADAMFERLRAIQETKKGGVR